MMGELLTCKELAWRLKKDVSYVYAMRAAGFPMHANLATLAEALEWIESNDFKKYKVYQKTKKEKRA